MTWFSLQVSSLISGISEFALVCDSAGRVRLRFELANSRTERCGTVRPRLFLLDEPLVTLPVITGSVENELRGSLEQDVKAVSRKRNRREVQSFIEMLRLHTFDSGMGELKIR